MKSVKIIPAPPLKAITATRPGLPFKSRGCHLEGPAEVPQFGEVLHFIDAGLGQASMNDRMIACQACRMAHCRFCTLAGPAAFKHDDRFGAAAADIYKSPSIHNGFKIAPDDRRLGVVNEPGQEIALVDIEFVADGAGLADAHDPVAHDVNEKTRREHAALNYPGN